MKKTRKFLTFALFSFISIASFATSHKIDSEETIENNDKKIDEDFGNILEELEEIDENENPSYSSKIFFSLPFNIGFNYPINNNECGKKDEFSFFGSRTLGCSLWVNFPLSFRLVYLSVGAELENSSFYWDGDRKICKIRTLSEENEKFLQDGQNDAIDFTKFRCWFTGVCFKTTIVTDKFDPLDGLHFSIGGGFGFRFGGSLEKAFKESYNSVKNKFSGNDELLGLKKFSAHMGLEAGYQRFGIFYKQFFNSIFNSEKVDKEKICDYPFCLGISFNLL